MTPCERLSLAIRYLREFAADGEQDSDARAVIVAVAEKLDEVRDDQFDRLSIELSIAAAWGEKPLALPLSKPRNQ